jgi:hypothetical protein
MASLATVVVQSVNQLIEEQRAIASNSRFTLTLFNHNVQLVHDAVPLSDVQPLLPAQYEPNGATAIDDAIASLIRTLSPRAPGQGNSVMAVVITDGEENSSREYRKEDVRQMIGYRQATHGWQFIYIGPKESFSYAEGIGIPRANCTSFESDPDRFRALLERLSKAVAGFRLGDRQFMLKLKG